MPTSDVPARGAVVVLPFPYADRLTEKRRPALVVSTPELARRHGIVWIAMITSAANAGWTDDIAISDLGSAGLKAPSVIRPAKLATVDLNRVVRVAGLVTDDDLAAVRTVLSRLMR